ncbi:LacI family DNA-binding transcriptional regulator [Streptomyces sp. NPDC048659]|uniref:LacI family DNA-binding transcriptional regulator n=1 Tax=Streptomyces sp. NPDC048659 TaxID=3155489 RepID=UPI0034236EB8
MCAQKNGNEGPYRPGRPLTPPRGPAARRSPAAARRPSWEDVPPPGPRTPTLKEIADEAGVSPTAVSFALNNRAGVSDETRRRILSLASQMGRRVPAAGPAADRDRSRAIGLVLARPAGSLGVEAFFLQVVSGIQAALAPHDHALVFQMVDDIDAECELYRRWWTERRVDGVIVVDPRVSDPRPETLAVLGLPAVVIGALDSAGPDGPDSGPHRRRAALSTLWADDAGAMDLIVHHLHELGHRRIAHMAGPPGLAHTARRIAALRSAARRLGLDHIVSVTTDFSDRQGVKAARRLLGASLRPTALICHNEVMAVTAAGVATERGLRIPEDVSIVSWEDSAICRTFHPPLSALTREPGSFGRRAAAEVLHLLAGAESRRLQDPLPSLEIRESCGPAPLDGRAPLDEPAPVDGGGPGADQAPGAGRRGA